MEATSPLPHRFNVRVYGLLIDSEREAVLVSKEKYAGILMTKFPGGGLEYGEGLADGLRREYMEELGRKVEIGELFYVNDFLQISAFDPGDQLLSIYYKVSLPAGERLPEHPQPGDPDLEGKLSFFWQALADIRPERFSFPVDKVVAGKLAEISGR